MFFPPNGFEISQAKSIKWRRSQFKENYVKLRTLVTVCRFEVQLDPLLDISVFIKTIYTLLFVTD